MNKPGNIIWKELISGWWQKTFITSKGLPKFTYHYSRKNGEQCKVIVINTKIAKRLGGFQLLEKDIRETKLLHELYLKYSKDGINDDVKLLIKSIVKSIIVTYGKCFVTADGRKVRLDKKVISERNVNTHKLLILMRHQFVAHAGDGFEHCNVVYAVPPSKKIKKGQKVCSAIFSEIVQTITFESFSSEMEALLKEVYDHICGEIQKLEHKLNEQFSDITISALSKYKGDAQQRIHLEEDDLKSISE